MIEPTSATLASESSTHPRGARILRWRIALLLAAAIAISYLDRQTLPVAIKAIQQDIPISNERFSLLQSAFLLSYAFMYAGGGKLLDFLGTRRGFTLIMIFWSFACMSHGLAVNLFMLVASRLLLGLGEGGGFPAGSRAVAEWFPVTERSMAMGIMNAGSAVGAVLAPPLIALILVVGNWRWVFFVSGLAGFLWIFWWRSFYFPPNEHPKISKAERDQLARAIQEPDPAERKVRWIELFRFPEIWGIVAAKFLSDGAWYFYLFWLPKYLYDARGFDIKSVGAFAWIPYAASGIGCLCGGGLSSWLLHRHLSLNRARKIALGMSAALMPFVLFVPHVPIALAIALFSLTYFGHQSWSTLVMSLPADLFPKYAVGAVAGLIGCGGALGGVAFGQLVGYLLDHGFSYRHVFALASSFHVISFGLICLAVPVIQPLRERARLRQNHA